MKISFVIPSRNNLKYLKWCYNAIRNNQGEHIVEICVADDFSSDGTWEWCQQILAEGDTHFKCIRNEGPDRIGLTILYNTLVNEVASHDICMIYHADMYLCPGALDAIEKHIGPKKIVSLTRIEPPLHPPGLEKVIFDAGIEPELFNESALLEKVNSLWQPTVMDLDRILVTEGVFAPWAFMKADFQEIGGHDELFAPQTKEDSDIFNRFQLNGVKFVQTWQGYVYHMTCRGSRFNPTITTVGQNSPEWEAQNQRSSRNFIRKWGHFVKHDQYMKPIIPHKYNIGFVVHNCTYDLLELLEPWCTNIYIKDQIVADQYIAREQPNTKFNLKDRVRAYQYNDADKPNDIVIEFYADMFSQMSFNVIQNLADWLEFYEVEPGEFEADIFKIKVNQVKTYEKNLVICQKQ
jgi:glycosyltransferase involved in cell wall biosynthesis